MKRIITYLILGLVVLSSCDDMIEIEPKNSVTYYNYLKTEKDLQTIVNQMHYLLREGIFANMNYPSIMGVYMDDIDDYNAALRKRLPSKFTSDSYESSWSRYYKIVTWANITIENIDLIDMPKERKNFYLGQAYYMRSFMYFKMAQIWGNVPIIDATDVFEAKGQAPWKEVILFAISDAEKASELLKPWAEQKDIDGNAPKTKQIPGKGTAYALLSHLHAWIGEFGNEKEHVEKAVTYATYVIDGNPEENYNPEFALAADPEAVVTEALMGTSSENIFNGDFTVEEANLRGSNNFHFSYLYQGWPIIPGAEKGDLKKKTFKIKNETVNDWYRGDDLRRKSYFYEFESLENDELLDGNAVVHLRRTPIMDEKSQTPKFLAYEGDRPIFRLAGIILLRAECLAKLNRPGEAVKDLNTVRQRAKADPYTSDEGALFDVIFHEREKELLFEGHRWFDLLRTGLWRKYLHPEVPQYTEQEIKDGALFYPVYHSAFKENPFLRQNQYWLSKW